MIEPTFNLRSAQTSVQSTLNSSNTSKVRFEPKPYYINIEPELALADQPQALINQVADKLLGGDISETLRSETAAMMERWDSQQGKVVEAIHMIATSPEFATLR